MAFYVGGGWYFSGQIGLSTFDAAAPQAAATRHSYTIPVTSADISAGGRGVITLSVPRGRRELVTEGTWGVLATDISQKAGPVIAPIEASPIPADDLQDPFVLQSRG